MSDNFRDIDGSDASLSGGAAGSVPQFAIRERAVRIDDAKADGNRRVSIDVLVRQRRKTA